MTADVEEVAGQKDAALNAITSQFWISPVNLIPLVVLVFLSLRKFSPFLSILCAALVPGILAAFTQPDLVRSFADNDALGIVGATIAAIYESMATGYVSDSGVEAIDSLFSRGGMASMLTTIWLVLGALSFAAVMEYAGFLNRLIEPVIAHARTTTRLIFAVGATAIGLNIVAGDQYIAVVLPARTFRLEFQRRLIHPRVLSRAIEDTGTVTSPLVPWNSCGAYMSGTLGVSTFEYFPYCFLNLLNPVISMLFAITGFQITKVGPPDQQQEKEGSSGGPTPSEPRAA
jgi:NhaC family Na+:H+ antiporter